MDTNKIKTAIEFAKNNPDSAYATELRRRIESGSLNNELESAGLTQYIKKTEPTTVEKIGSGIKETFSDLKQGISNTAKDIKSSIDKTYETGSQEYQKYQAGEESLASGLGKSIIGAGQGALQEAGGIANTAGQVVGATLTGGFKVADAIAQGSLSEAGKQILSTKPVQELLTKAQSGNGLISIDKYNEWKSQNPDSAKNLEAVIDIVSLIPIARGIKDTSKVAKATGIVAKDLTKSGVKTVGEGLSKTKNIISKVDVKAPELFPIDAPDNIKTSLNPFLTNTKAEISVPTKNGFILKTIDKITPEEKIAVQRETNNLYSKLENTAKQFKEDRRDILSPLEIVGQRTDKLGLEKANKLRISEGKKMGKIENLFKDKTVDLSGDKINNFINEFLGSEKKFGRTVKDKTFIEDFAKDYDKLTKNPNVKNTLDFTRTWTNELEDLKDNFGGFKDNKRTYTLVEGAIKDIKNNTRNLIAKDNKKYAKALSNYRLTSKIREEANRLMGKEGLAGERLKGGALAKRAVQSSSDAGARQFYNILKKVTGYDGLKEADIAIQAMKDVGDYQGLSLLEVNKDLYNATVGKIVSSIPGGQAVSETTKALANKLVPQEKRVKKLINK